ncbi:hypothetical protein TBLA_0A02900 [Henningerozyma blattae CBS 6284]|uniref:Fatty acid hydroxylase domain-containing protein n=1 Tax=Henningerozyma blattae (strain ATCC 34711 / CBS 6284 / DSM 70876 / NBRC 10599 / NRRL Y-10934 / UCD 77-7) TaxID=1071380 RepID=I2GVD8_HENB6|nr:hypothetical protein TBLA_0A02900 [Tetrapisispora blattae CBS 6284]CCH58090.1 hypothetical protein TBLA_0A02900 [Tetrapisispora blattae CBS 6284]
MNCSDSVRYPFLHGPQPPISLKARPDLLSWMSDGTFALVAPVVAYWVFSLFFHVIDTFKLLEKYRIHPPEEIASKNHASRLNVLAEVIFQHLLQTVVGFWFNRWDGHPVTGFEKREMWNWRRNVPGVVPDVLVVWAYRYGLSFVKLTLGFMFIDTWQYWLHYLMHANRRLYKMFHSVHHRLYVPYAYGALYNAPMEGLILDTLGTGLAMVLTGLTHREELVLFTFATLKTVDDHCGYAIPADPFQWFFPNNAVYHDIHHQTFGMNYNFAQPFFTFWDSLVNTQYPDFQAYSKQQRRISIDKYKEFLAKREQEKREKIAKLKDANAFIKDKTDAVASGVAAHVTAQVASVTA